MPHRISGLLALILATLFAGLPARAGVIKHIVVIAMENTDASSIYGNKTEAPYINNVLIPQGARASNFIDTLPLSVPSQGHYMIMEAGTNQFPDKTFTASSDPSASYSTASLNHLAHQLRTAGRTWMSYQQSMNSTTGACPIKSVYPYAPRHNPFTYFQSVSGNPPSKINAYCAAHHRNTTLLNSDIGANALADYVFISPDLCNDMHDKCASSSRIRAGDDFLSRKMPALINWANANAGVIFVMWDEGEKSQYIPFIAVGAGIKKNYVSGLKFTHHSLVRTVERVFGLPVLSTVSAANSFRDLFIPGYYP